MLDDATPTPARSHPRFGPTHALLDATRSDIQAAYPHARMPPLNSHFVFTRSGYHVRFAHGSAHLQKQVGQLVHSMYDARGLQIQGSAPQSQRAGQTTLAACTGDHVFGTLTLGIDSPIGLLADTLYRKEIDDVRAGGGRVCEVTRLAVDSTVGSPDVLATIFNIAFILARHVHHMTDLFAEVHPRHAGFYQRLMGYRIAGPERTCPRVGAPAVLMHLCLDHAEQQIRKLAGNPDTGERSLYRHFLPQPQQQAVVRELVEPLPVAA
ncbi:MAG TPA: long-chain N-acyl amino acid synthase [Rhodocyclaceae bacterium]|nr:long-chain N-acyl amino acid synthase [Rhodocyclaceae bacterium]